MYKKHILKDNLLKKKKRKEPQRQSIYKRNPSKLKYKISYKDKVIINANDSNIYFDFFVTK